MAENQGQEGDLIFTQTDPSFNLVLHALSELNGQGRLSLLHVQTASIQDIESADELDDFRLRFGGQTLPGRHAFGRTASAILRMCMLRAANVEFQHWPVMNETARQRNVDKLEFMNVYHAPEQPQEFILANDRPAARVYWSKYDHLYPHFLIEDKVSGEIGTQVSIPTMMLIIRNNFTEVVELTTNFNATPQLNKMFNSYVHVTCIVRGIMEKEGVKDEKRTQALKEMMSIPTISIEPYPKPTQKQLEDAKAEQERKNLVSAFNKNLVIKSEDD